MLGCLTIEGEQYRAVDSLEEFIKLIECFKSLDGMSPSKECLNRRYFFNFEIYLIELLREADKLSEKAKKIVFTNAFLS